MLAKHSAIDQSNLPGMTCNLKLCAHLINSGRRERHYRHQGRLDAFGRRLRVPLRRHGHRQIGGVELRPGGRETDTHT